MPLTLSEPSLGGLCVRLRMAVYLGTMRFYPANGRSNTPITRIPGTSIASPAGLRWRFRPPPSAVKDGALLPIAEVE